MNRILTPLLATARALLIASLALLPFSAPVYAAATTQTTHGWLCAPPMPVSTTVAPEASCVAWPASGPIVGPDAVKARLVGDVVVPM